MKKLTSNNEKNIILNILGAFFVKGGAAIISVILLPLYISFFDNQTILGIWYTILSVLNWINLFDLGLGNGLRNLLPECFEKKDRLSARKYISTTYIAITIIAVCASCIGGILVSVANWNTILNVSERIISKQQLTECVIIVFWGVILHIVLKTIKSILYAIQKSAWVNALAMISNLIILLSLLIVPSFDLTTNLRNMAIINAFAINFPYLICSIILFATVLKGCYPSVKFFEKKFIKNVLGIGLSLFWLTLVFMLLTSMNEFFISRFTSPDNVLYYQAYNKVFHTGAVVISLALTPIWSAVTQAQAQKNYCWIKKIYKLFLYGTIGCVFIEIGIVPFLQLIMDIWLKKDAINVNYAHAVAFAILSTLMILHNVNISIGNGLSYFKVQLIWMTVAAVFYIPLAYVLVGWLNSWIGIIWSAIICLLPYEFIAPFCTMRMIDKKVADN